MWSDSVWEKLESFWFLIHTQEECPFRRAVTCMEARSVSEGQCSNPSLTRRASMPLRTPDIFSRGVNQDDFQHVIAHGHFDSAARSAMIDPG